MWAMDSFTLQASPVKPGDNQQTDLNILDAPHYAAGQTAYATGSGFWIGVIDGVPKFSFGDVTAGKYVTWDGSTLSIGGSAVLGTAPLVKEVIDSGTSVTISTDYVMILADRIVIDGTLTINGTLCLVA